MSDLLTQHSKKKGKDFVGWAGWHVLHCFAVKYTPDKKAAAKKLLDAYAELFPCDKCRVNFRKKMEQFPIDNYLDTNHNFFFWTYLAHDAVNQYLGKKSPPYTDVKRIYFGALEETCLECQV